MIPTWGLCSAFLCALCCATFWGSCLKVAVTSILISKSLTQPPIHSIPINFIFLSNSKCVQNISSGSLGTSFWKSFIVTLNNSFPVIFQSVSLMLDKLNCLTAHCSQCLTCKTDLNMINVDFDFFLDKNTNQSSGSRGIFSRSCSFLYCKSTCHCTIFWWSLLQNSSASSLSLLSESVTWTSSSSLCTSCVMLS